MIHGGIIARKTLFSLFHILPIRNNKILFSNFEGKGYGDNPKYICEALKKTGKNYDYIWVVNNIEMQMPQGVRKVLHYSWKEIYEAATAKIWIDNYRKSIWYKKRKGQFYIQTWHSGVSPKQVEKAAEDTLPIEYIERAKHDSHMIDIFLSGSRWETETYLRDYWYKGPVLKTGVPRQDILQSEDQTLVKKIKIKYNISEDTNVLLYAPTFRKNMTDLSVYSIDFDRLKKTVHDKFGGKWIIAVRLHPGLNLNTSDYFSKGVMDFTDYPDAQELLLISDLLITDYSGIIFDFAFTKHPSFIYALDYEEYRKDRNTCFDLRKLPFPFSESEEQLLKNIESFDIYEYHNKLDHFLRDECGIYFEKDASDKVSDIIERFILQKEPYYNDSLIDTI